MDLGLPLANHHSCLSQFLNKPSKNIYTNNTLAVYKIISPRYFKTI